MFWLLLRWGGHSHVLADSRIATVPPTGVFLGQIDTILVVYLVLSSVVAFTVHLLLLGVVVFAVNLVLLSVVFEMHLSTTLVRTANIWETFLQAMA